jgi:glycosyltransferase involved in cell wall biosynthesis
MSDSFHNSPTSEVKISYIVPVYNAEKFILACLRSIIDQNIAKIEILCVDDCSTDDSIAIIQRESLKDPRIRLLRNTLNLGAPTARNNGIGQAIGKYLVFVDADDELLKNSISSLYLQAEKTGADATKGLMFTTTDHRLVKPHPLNQSREVLGTNLVDCVEIQHLYQYQSYVFRRSVINDNRVLFNPTLRNFQDPEFLSRLLSVCAKIDVTLVPVYLRINRENSIISSQWSYENFDSLIRGARMALQHLVNTGHFGAADLMSKTLLRWWYKLEAIPNSLSKEECLELYERINDFSSVSRTPIYDFSLSKAGAYHALRLIDQKSYDRCYDVMAQSVLARKYLPRPFAKTYDLILLCFELLLRRA